MVCADVVTAGLPYHRQIKTVFTTAYGHTWHHQSVGYLVYDHGHWVLRSRHDHQVRQEDEDMSQTDRKESHMWTPKLIGFLVLLALSLILMLQNLNHVDLNVLFWDFRIRLIWVLLGGFLLGSLIGWLLPHLRDGLRKVRRR